MREPLEGLRKDKFGVSEEAKVQLRRYFIYFLRYCEMFTTVTTTKYLLGRDFSSRWNMESTVSGDINNSNPVNLGKVSTCLIGCLRILIFM